MSETYFIVRRDEQNVIINVYWSASKVLVNFVRF